MIFFSADHHVAHANIIKYTNRPFADIHEMNRELVIRWNKVVGSTDTVYYLGDLTLGGLGIAMDFLSQLNGKIYILLYPYHHDKNWLAEGRQSILSSKHQRVEYCPGLHVVEVSETPFPISLCHYPLAQWERSHYGAIHLHAHSHGNYHARGAIHDVGVDNNSYAPISLIQVLQIIEKKLEAEQSD